MLLGPVEVWAGPRQVEVGSPRQGLLLAALAVDAGRVVPVGTVEDRLWGQQPPAQARRTLHSYLGRLRRVVGQVPGPGGRPVQIVRRAGGYLLAADPGQVDVHRFRHLVEQAREPGCAGGRRLEVLREAVGLWRGVPLTGIAGEWAERMRRSWQEQHVVAVLAWARAEVAAGRPEVVLVPLAELAAEHPLVEPVAAARMRALAAAGRPADALTCFTAMRRRLAEELGADPGAELRAAHEAVLRGEVQTAPDCSPDAPGAAAPAARADPAHPPAGADAGLAQLVLPGQLPADVTGFAGRGEHLTRLDALLDAAARQPGATVICAVSGPAGVGKTSLAVHWAHQVAGRFPDGHLYANLRGFDPAGRPVEPAAAIRAFLDALGVPAERVPTGLDAQAALYRSLLAGRRMLVVLDNVRDAGHARPLLPGAATTFTVVTSRNQLTALVAALGAHPFRLDLLTREESVELLARRLPAQVAAEPAAVETVIACCCGLPLALGVAAARAEATPLATVAAQLADAGQRLGSLDAGDPATQVRAVFSWSIAALRPAAARLFRLLGVHPGPDLTVPAAASLLGVPAAQARPLLAELARANLVTELVTGPAPARYGWHSLLADYAAELTRRIDPAEHRAAATARLIDHATHSAFAASQLRYPDRDPILRPLGAPAPGVAVEEFADVRRAAAWLAAEHPALLAAARLAAGAGCGQRAWQLAWSLDPFLHRRGHWPDAVEVWQLAAAAADEAADPAAAAYAHRGLAVARTQSGHPGEAEAHLRQALELFAAAGDGTGQARTHLALSMLCDQLERPDRGLEHDRAALALFRAAGHLRGQADALNALGWDHAMLGEHERALEYCGLALALHGEVGDRFGQATDLDSLGYAHHQLGRHAAAIGCYRRAIELLFEIGDRYLQAATLARLGDVQHDAGRPEAARPAWVRALDMFTDLGHPEADRVRARLSDLG